MQLILLRVVVVSMSRKCLSKFLRGKPTVYFAGKKLLFYQLNKCFESSKVCGKNSLSNRNLFLIM